MGPGSKLNDAINRLIGAFGSTDIDYAISVFDSLNEVDQVRHQRALTEAAIRSGGREEGEKVALDLLSRESEALQDAGRKSLQHVHDLYHDPEERLTWLRSLNPDVLRNLDQAKLPTEFRSLDARPEDRWA